MSFYNSNTSSEKTSEGESCDMRCRDAEEANISIDFDAENMNNNFFRNEDYDYDSYRQSELIGG